MPRRVSVAPALTQAEIDALALTLPVSGDWLYTTTGITIGGDCAAIMDASMFPETSQVVRLEGFFNIDPAGNFQNMQVPEFGNPEFANPEPGVFVSEFSIEGATMRYEIHVLSQLRLRGSWNMDMAQEGFTCSFNVPSPWPLKTASRGTGRHCDAPVFIADHSGKSGLRSLQLVWQTLHLRLLCVTSG
jgi:hypothetical protein